ncbi:hypothetical protein LPJ66_002496 [Kickxella alabastrina]|uniref:Uncharacterized protein n=1 Tax=Kickxella alabastrina TaxID=61397 RepID=A0ACC1IQD4_9FUNG|nr:hypothetical protein LPJ66_002496 [Kickxella alabastrina]
MSSVVLASAVPHVDYISQLTRHLVSVPATVTEFPKRSAIAIVIRLALSEAHVFPTVDTNREKSPAGLTQTIQTFLDHPSLKNARAQILFIQRSKYLGDPWSGHIGFPGGKQEATDVSDMETAERETREELGLDLSDSKFVHLGRLDDTSVNTLLGGLIMVVSPHVYLQVCRETPAMQVSMEVASVHWIDFGEIVSRIDNPIKPFVSSDYRAIPLDIASRSFDSFRISQPWWYRGFRKIFGSLHYTILPLTYTAENSIWGESSKNSINEEKNGRYAGVQFVSSTELYLWGISLVMLCNMVDLSLPFDPRQVNPEYVSVASPWPQMERYLWADFNWIINAMHRIAWDHYKRKPWLLRMDVDSSGVRVVGQHKDFFRTYLRVAKVAFPISCLVKASLFYLSGKYVVASANVLVKLLSRWAHLAALALF